MTEEQKLRYELIRNTSSVDKARECYNFIMGNDDKPRMKPPMNCIYIDGIYLCYEGGKRQLYDGTNPTERVAHIGIKVGNHMVGIRLISQGKHKLPYNSDLDKDDFDYKRYELHALDDFNGKANTEHLKRHGEFDFDLEDDDWIPALGELAIIFKDKDKLNEALAYVGGDKLVEDWYWSSTEYNTKFAWQVGFSRGVAINYSKFNSYVVRPVCEF